MTKNQEAFLREYLVSGDKMAAYRLAYPNAKETSIKAAVNRLLRTNPEIEKAVHDKDQRLDQQAEQKVLEQKIRKYVAKYEVQELLANVIHGTELTEKIYRTRDGFERQYATPSVSQKIAAANACIRMAGWGRAPARVKQKKEEKEAKPEEWTPPEILIAGIPIDDYSALHGNTSNAYFDPEERSGSWWPLDIDMGRYMELQRRREARKDAERQQRMTPQLQLEEEQAIKAFERRPVDEATYLPQDKVIEELREDYIATKDKDKLRELQAVQKMCGLRFQPHRHRYEAEREAGWEFHPLNNNLIRKAGNKNEELSKSSPIRQQLSEAVSLPPLNTSPIRQQKETNQRSYSHQGRHVERSETSSEPVQIAIPEPPAQTSPIPNQKSPIPDHKTLLQQGYTPLKELLQDEFDYYIRNQGSTTWKQKQQLERFSAHRNAPPEIRKQIEQETGWFYHPEVPHYAKRDPARPLVRTRFKGLPRYP